MVWELGSIIIEPIQCLFPINSIIDSPVVSDQSFTIPSSPVLAKNLPFGLRAIAAIDSSLAMVLVTVPSGKCHNLIVWSKLPLTRVWLSLLIASDRTEALCSVRLCSNLPASRSHNLIISSQLPLASNFPSGLTARAKTPLGWSTRVWITSPVSSCHSLIVLSKLPLTSFSPSGVKHRHLTQSLWAVIVCWRSQVGLVHKSPLKSPEVKSPENKSPDIKSSEIISSRGIISTSESSCGRFILPIPGVARSKSAGSIPSCWVSWVRWRSKCSTRSGNPVPSISSTTSLRLSSTPATCSCIDTIKRFWRSNFCSRDWISALSTALGRASKSVFWAAMVCLTSAVAKLRAWAISCWRTSPCCSSSLISLRSNPRSCKRKLWVNRQRLIALRIRLMRMGTIP